MTKTEIEEYLIKLEYKLLIEAKRHSIELNRQWPNQFPETAGVYVLRDKNEICYVGETGKLRGRMIDILDTRNHTFRRSLGSSLFCDRSDYTKVSPSKTFCPDIEELLNSYISTNLSVSLIPVILGRKELEETLIDKFLPRYNQKGKRGTKKSYTKVEKQQAYYNAYKPWTKEDDEELKVLFFQRKTIKDLSKIFGRNEGAIRSRVDKLKLKKLMLV